MKMLTKSLAKIKVLKSEPKLVRETGRQDMDKDGNPLWSVTILDAVFNEEFNFQEQKAVKYKSLVDLEVGKDHIVNLKVSSMGEGSGNFIKVNSFYTILESVSEKTTMLDFFGSADIVIANSGLHAKKTTKPSAQASIQ